MYDKQVLLQKIRLSIKEAASLIGVHDDTIRRWIKSGKLSVVKTAGGHHRVKTESAKLYL